MNKDYELDKIDKQILSILMKNANSTYAEIASILEVSGGTIHVRMKKLEQMGVITGMHLITNYAKLGFDICAYIGLDFSDGANITRIREKCHAIPELTHFDVTTGRYNAILQIVCKNNLHLLNILEHKICTIGGIARYEILISLDCVFSRKIDLVAIDDNRDFEEKN